MTNKLPRRDASGIKYNPFIAGVIFSALLLISSTVDAKTSPFEYQALDLQLHDTAMWHTLLHYRPNVFGGDVQSEANDESFFLSEDGETDAKAELIETIRKLTSDIESVRIETACQFPARAHWLQNTLGLPVRSIESCPQLKSWLQELNTESVTLVFAASHLSNPSSMYGHTFLRLDSNGNNGGFEPLNAHTISYAAATDPQDNMVAYTWKGLFGGYPGVTTVEPYYERVNQYSNNENRDLFEYRLNLQPDEITMLLLHAWEIKDRDFDYYFFTQNCSYRLLALIDAARPGIGLVNEVSTHAIPTDTVRWMEDRDLIEEFKYRPALETEARYGARTLPEQLRTYFQNLISGESHPADKRLSELPEHDRIKLLDTSIDYIRYSRSAQAETENNLAHLTSQLLKARSFEEGTVKSGSPSAPEIHPHQGHGTLRTSAGIGRQDNETFTSFNLRAAYHDLLDPPQGYQEGALLEMLAGELRYYPSDNEFQVEEITGINLRSISPTSRLFRERSWELQIGARRSDTEKGRRLTPFARGGVGKSWQKKSWVPYFFITGDAEISPHLRRGQDYAPGYSLNLLRQGHKVSLLSSLSGKHWLASGRSSQHSIQTDFQYHFSMDLGLRFQVKREKLRERYQTSTKLTLNMYF